VTTLESKLELGTEADLDVASDAALLARMAARDADLHRAHAAFATFYQRHIRWLWATVSRMPHAWRLLGGQEGVEDVIQDTFCRAYERAATFIGDDIDPGRLRRRTRAWLGRIADNLIVDALRKGGGLVASDVVRLDHRPSEPAAPEAESRDVSARGTRLRATIERLPERDQDILWVWAQYYRPGVQHQRLPDDVSQALAARWGTSPQAIRQRRKRVLDQLRRQLDERGPDHLEERNG